jgi:L-ascorbate metabolism protein UlaG (beta-lactamase superfamily)
MEEPPSIEVAWLGHATVDVRLGPTRFLTDPVLRDRVAHLRRHRGTPVLEPGPLDAVLISHLHHDHLDLASLRRLTTATPLVVPRGAGRLVARGLGTTRRDVVELGVGDDLVVDGTRITAVPADHRPNRFLSRTRSEPLGFLLERDGRVVYFPGDTDLHPVMTDLPRPDLALLPIWGWGRTIGPGHLDPARAAIAAATMDAGAVLPVHWGTFAPVGLARSTPRWFDRPAESFVASMAREAPGTALRLVEPGPVRHRFD